MSELNLVKGEKLALDKVSPGLTKVKVGLGWDANGGNGGTYDLDAQVVMLNAAGKVIGPGLGDSLVYYNNLSAPGIVHNGDNLTGAGDGDDEVIDITLADVKSDVAKLVFTVTIHEAAEKSQNFGQVRNAFIRLVNPDTNAEITRFDLSEDASSATGMQMAELYRHNGSWKFGALEVPTKGNLSDLVKLFS